MKKIKKFISIFFLSIFGVILLSPIVSVSAQNAYDSVLGITVDSRQDLQTALDGGWEVAKWYTWAKVFNEQVLRLIGYVVDVFIVIWIGVAFIWGYKIMTSEKEDTLKEWIRLLVFWIIWIIIMVSARFLSEKLVWDVWNASSTGIISKQFRRNATQPNWIQLSEELYKNIMYPFIKVALYFVVWILFFAMVAKIIGFVTATDDSAKKKAWGVIIWCIIWILIVMWSKQLVEYIMGSQDEVLNKSAARIDEQWKQVLEFGSMPIISQIINWVMWLTMFAIVVLIIVQWYKLFTKPDDPKTRESLKKSIIYIIIWVLIIGAAYVISNVLILNKINI